MTKEIREVSNVLGQGGRIAIVLPICGAAGILVKRAVDNKAFTNG